VRCEALSGVVDYMEYRLLCQGMLTCVYVTWNMLNFHDYELSASHCVMYFINEKFLS